MSSSSGNNGFTKRRNAKTRARQHEVRLLMLKGEYSPLVIAGELQCAVATAERDLKAVREEMAAEFREHQLSSRALQFARIEEVHRQANEAWEKSKADEVSTEKEKSTINVIGDHDGVRIRVPADKLKVREKRKGQAGDPSFLRIQIDAMKRLADLLGLDAPKQYDVSTEEQRRFAAEFMAVFPAWAETNCTEEQLLELADALDQGGLPAPVIEVMNIVDATMMMMPAASDPSKNGHKKPEDHAGNDNDSRLDPS